MVWKGESKRHSDVQNGKRKKIFNADNYTKKILAQVDKSEFNGYKMGDLRKIFEKYQDEKDWKNPIDVIVSTKSEADMLFHAIRVFQADVPSITEIEVPVRHKEGLIWMQGTAYNVRSNGYQGW